MKKVLLDVLACPLCKGKSRIDRNRQIIVCKADKLVYPMRNDIPIMKVTESYKMDEKDLEELT